MTTLIYTHKACMNHDTGHNHPERAERLRAVLDALTMPSMSVLDHREAPLATLSQLTRVHSRAYIDQVLSTVPFSGHAYLDPDTVISPRSGEAARRAAGAVCGAVDAVMSGDTTRVFCAIRPPGHHADPDHAMGFCIFNNVAVGAAHALVQYGIERVAIVDFDVHHGNGTQNIFSREPRILLTGSHQMPLYPGSGAAFEVGLGNIVNMPLTPNSGRKEFEAQWRTHGLTRLASFEPQLIFISAGFDGHRDDPLAQLDLVEADYAWLTNEVVEIAEQSAAGRVVSTLEGGYQLDALAASCVTHVKALM